ncbi:MAG: 2-hydroxyacid dehydrogenase [Succinivibrio sp.]|nr:2-hydroxyacid dehydrogenase [Succinivibrio sp.]
MQTDKIILQDTHATLQQSFVDALAQRGKLYIRKKMTPDEYEKILPEVEIMVTSGGSKVPEEYMAKCPKLRLISDFGVGYDGVDVEAAKKRGIMVTNTPGVMKDDVADTAIALMLNTVRRFVAAHNYERDGHWLEAAFPLSRSLTGLKVGIAGLGRIGAEIATRAQAFKTEVAYFQRHRANVPYQYFDNLKDLAAWSDVLIIIMPASASTKGIVNGDILSALGPEGYLINVARGSIVDQEALAAALLNGTIAGAGLDVFAKEPQVPPEFLTLPNLVLAPHIGSATVQTRNAMASLVLENIDAYIAGKPLPTPVPELA